MAKIAAFDFWEHACRPPDQVGHPLILGRSSSEAVVKYLKLPRRAVFSHTAEITTFTLPRGWTQVRGDLIDLLFDENDVWQSISYGLGSDELTWQVQAAIVPDDQEIKSDATAGKLPLLLRGRALQNYATLPSFVTMGSFAEPEDTMPLWEVKGREYDKWLSLYTLLPQATLGAEFVLKANKARFESRFEIDYCLTRLSLFTPAFYAALNRDADGMTG